MKDGVATVIILVGPQIMYKKWTCNSDKKGWAPVASDGWTCNSDKKGLAIVTSPGWTFNLDKQNV